LTRSAGPNLVKLLDDIEDERGVSMADHTLAIIRRIMGWYSVQNDDYCSPVVKGMSRIKPKESSRKRVLTDDEIRAIWKAADELGTPFGHMLQYILLTATRRNEALHLRRTEIDGNVWTIPKERYKTKVEVSIPLAPAALVVLGRLLIIGKSDGYVFSLNGEKPIAGLSRLKASFDEVAGVKGWTIHDLRRTASMRMNDAASDPISSSVVSATR
jgi:integrase